MQLFKSAAARTLLLLGILACSLLAEGQEHKGVLYTKPAKWTERLEGEAKIFTPADLKSGELLAILLTPAVAATGAPKDQFAEAVKDANEGSKVLSKGDIQSKTVEGGSVQSQVFQLDTPDIGKHNRLYTMIFAGKQTVLVVVLVNQDSLLEKHSKAVGDFILSIKFKSAPSPAQPGGVKPATGKIPTGDTPDLFPGTMGWRPSGKGLPIPNAAIVAGKPQGLWWDATVRGGQMVPELHLYMPNGIHATNPRFGGGTLYDLEGQKRQKGVTGVGTFSVANGRLKQTHDGFKSDVAFSAGQDGGGKYFKAGGAIFRPFAKLSRTSIVGVTWRSGSAQITFGPDGRYEAGSTLNTGEWAVGSRSTGKYTIEGWLLMLEPDDAPLEIMVAGMAGPILVKGSRFYTKG